MRLFIGIALAGDVRARLEREIGELRRAGAPVRWCAPQTIHLTLKFIGEVEPETGEAVAGALEIERLRVGPLALHIRGLGHFGRGSEVRVVWAGVEPLAGLDELHAGIESVLSGLRIPRDERPFSPHITLGRGRGGNCKTLLERIAGKERVPIADTTAASFQLFESRLTPGGAVHTVRREYPLA